MFLNSRHFWRNSLKLTISLKSMVSPLSMDPPLGNQFPQKVVSTVSPIFCVRQLVWPAIQRWRQGMASAHTLLPCCCSRTTVRQCPSRRLFGHVTRVRLSVSELAITHSLRRSKGSRRESLSVSRLLAGIAYRHSSLMKRAHVHVIAIVRAYIRIAGRGFNS